MPIIEAHVGELSIHARFKNGGEEYLNAKMSYGRTHGELLDNLAMSSLKLAGEVCLWISENKSSEYSLENDNWYSSMSHPDLIAFHVGNKKFRDFDMALELGDEINSIHEIVTTGITLRHRSIDYTLSKIADSTKGERKIPLESKVSYLKIREAKSFEEMLNCGFTGVELDEILENNRNESYHKKYDRLKSMGKKLYGQKV